MASIESIPKYLQLAETLEGYIRSGAWSKGKTPTVRLLASEHRVSVVTASRALQVLRDKGLVQTIERSGCFLIPRKEQADRWALCLRVTPGPFQTAVQSLSLMGFRKLSQDTGAEFATDVFVLDKDTDEADIQRQVQRAVKNHYAGLFLLPSRLDDRSQHQDEVLVRACKAQGLPVVLLERNLRGVNRPLEHDLVCCDDLHAGRTMTEHLLRVGCNRIAFVTGSPTSTHLDRLAGYVATLSIASRSRQYGQLDATPLIIQQPEGLYSRETYALIADQVLDAKADGVICYQDYTAIGLTIELYRRGVVVPNQIAIAGFENLPIGNTFSIGITTYDYPSEALARHAIRLMRARLVEPNLPIARVVLASSLIVRDSTQREPVPTT